MFRNGTAVSIGEAQWTTRQISYNAHSFHTFDIYTQTKKKDDCLFSVLKIFYKKDGEKERQFRPSS